jgi:ribokinase
VSARIVILGDIATDVVVELDGEPVPGSDVDATIRQVGGGAGGNVAVWCAAAGGDVVLVGRSGADAPGAERVTEIRAHGVTVHAATDPLLATGTIVAVTTPDGERTMYADRGANLALAADDVSDAVLAGAAHLHVSGYALLHPAPRPAARSVLTRARDRGLTTSVDLSSAAPLAAAGAAAFRAWTQDVDLCRGNRVEAEVLSGAAGAAAACRDLATAYAIAVVTDGRQGIWAASAGTVLHVPAVAATVVDTVGAGDAFTAGLLHALVSEGGWRSGSAPPDAALLERACAHGAALAAQAVSVAGGRPPPERSTAS